MSESSPKSGQTVEKAGGMHSSWLAVAMAALLVGLLVLLSIPATTPVDVAIADVGAPRETLILDTNR